MPSTERKQDWIRFPSCFTQQPASSRPRSSQGRAKSVAHSSNLKHGRADFNFPYHSFGNPQPRGSNHLVKLAKDTVHHTFGRNSGHAVLYDVGSALAGGQNSLDRRVNHVGVVGHIE